MPGQIRSNGVFGSSGASGDPKPDKGASKKGKSSKPKQLGAAECRAKMLQLLNMRDYSTSVMRSRLAKAGFGAKDIEAAIKMATDSHLMDDKRYASLYISYKKESGWGRQRIERELEKQGIACEELPGYPDEFFGDDDELERACQCLASHHTSAKNARDAHYRYLLSKGFSPSVASKALRALNIGFGED